MAIANRLARAIYYIIKNADERYKDLGEQRADPKKDQAKRLVKKLEKMGFAVQLSQVSA